MTFISQSRERDGIGAGRPRDVACPPFTQAPYKAP